MGALTIAELIQIGVALFQYGPQFVKFVEDERAKGFPLLKVPEEHLAELNTVLTSLKTKAVTAQSAER